MAVNGVFTSDSNIQGARTGDFSSFLVRTMPTGSASLFALSSGMKSKDATDSIVHWFEENHISGRTQLTAAVADGAATTINIDDASAYTPGVILLSESTGEYVLVTAITANALTVVRGHGGTTAAAIADNAYMQRIGNAFEEGSDRPPAVVNLGSPVFNYTQIFRNAWDVTGTAKAINTHVESAPAKNRRDAADFHAEDIERSLIWGKKSLGVKNGKPFHSMNGVNSFITTNVTAAGGTTNWTQVDAFLQGVFEKNIKGAPNERIAFCGNGAIAVLNQIARADSDVNISVGQTEFGLKVFNWLTPYGSISLMTHPLMTESPLWTKDIYVYHPAAITTRYLRRTETDEYDKDGTRAGRDGDFGVFTTELSVEYQAEKTGGQLTGLTSGVAT